MVLSGANRHDSTMLMDVLDAVVIAVPAPGDPERHPPRRWVVEVGHSWFNRFRRLQTRWEKRQDLYLGFVELAACLIIWRKLAPVAPLRKLSG